VVEFKHYLEATIRL